MKTNDFIRKQIRRFREDAGISQSEMAVQLHMDERNYKRIESGEKKTFDIELLDKIATLLHVSIIDLIVDPASIPSADDEIKENYRRIITEQKKIIDSSRKVADDMYQLLLDKIKQQNQKQG